MRTVEEGTLLWQPSAAVRKQAKLTRYMNWLQERRGLSFENYDALWRWSTTELEPFWQSIWEFAEIKASQAPSAVLPDDSMPGAVWFPDARLNYAENILARMADAGATI